MNLLVFTLAEEVSSYSVVSDLVTNGHYPTYHISSTISHLPYLTYHIPHQHNRVGAKHLGDNLWLSPKSCIQMLRPDLRIKTIIYDFHVKSCIQMLRPDLRIKTIIYDFHVKSCIQMLRPGLRIETIIYGFHAKSCIHTLRPGFGWAGSNIMLRPDFGGKRIILWRGCYRQGEAFADKNPGFSDNLLAQMLHPYTPKLP